MNYNQDFPVVSTDGLFRFKSTSMAVGEVREIPVFQTTDSDQDQLSEPHELGFEPNCFLSMTIPEQTCAIEIHLRVDPVEERGERDALAMPVFLDASLAPLEGPFESFNSNDTIGDYQYCKWQGVDVLRVLFHVPARTRFLKLSYRRWGKSQAPLYVHPVAKAAFRMPKGIIRRKLGLSGLTVDEANLALIQTLEGLTEYLSKSPLPGSIGPPASALAEALAGTIDLYFKRYTRRRSNLQSGDIDPHLVSNSYDFVTETGDVSVSTGLMDYHFAKGDLSMVAAVGEKVGVETLSFRRSMGLIKAQRHVDTMTASPESGKRARPNAEHSRRSKASGIYVLHNCHPFHSGGYASRAHGLVKGFADTSTPIVPFARLGYPVDRKRVDEVAPTVYIDDVAYHFQPDRARNLSHSGFDDYIDQNADYLTTAIREHKAPFIMAASFFTNGIAANIAARRVGIPSIYEVRGMEWLTKVSEHDWWGRSEECRRLLELELAAAKGADMVFHITHAVRDWLVQNGVDANKLQALPNAVDDTHFKYDANPDSTLRAELGIEPGDTVIGYIGTHVFYEGLDDLIMAFEGLRYEGRQNLKLLLVGDGAEHRRLWQMKQHSKFADDILLPGRVSHAEVPAYYDLIDISVLARKNLPICEMISPIKPFELFAMKKPVVSSDVAALAEIVEDGVRGALFEKGNSRSLQITLEAIIDASELRSEYADTAYDWVMQERTWSAVTSTGSKAIENLLKSYYPGRKPFSELNVRRFFSATR